MSVQILVEGIEQWLELELPDTQRGMTEEHLLGRIKSGFYEDHGLAFDKTTWLRAHYPGNEHMIEIRPEAIVAVYIRED